MGEMDYQLPEGTYSFLQTVSGGVAWPDQTNGRVEVKTGVEHEGQPCVEVTVMRTRGVDTADERYEFEVMCVNEGDEIVRQETRVMPRSGAPFEIVAPILILN